MHGIISSPCSLRKNRETATATQIFYFAKHNMLMIPMAIARKKKYGGKKDRTLRKSKLILVPSWCQSTLTQDDS
jgi:hypothetical protein